MPRLAGCVLFGLVVLVAYMYVSERAPAVMSAIMRAMEGDDWEMEDLLPKETLTRNRGRPEDSEEDEDDYLRRSQRPSVWQRYSGVVNRASICLAVVLLAVLTVGSVVVIFSYRSKPRPELEWWQTSVIYQIYPRSFQDSNGDGIGDLKGIERRIDYLEYLGVGAVWLSPIFRSPMRDFGYDVSSFTDIDPIFGTMVDFDSLLKALHEKGIKLILDFVPNHTSDQHHWFGWSMRSRDDSNPHRDYYVWADGRDGGPPNNWVSVFGGPAWTYVPSRDQWYLHQFLPEQPDLNFRCPEVRRHMENVLRFWLEKGVDGFRLDAVKHLVEAEDLSKDEPRNPHYRAHPDETMDQYDSLLHPWTTNLEETHAVIQDWKALMEEYSKEGAYRFMVTEVYDDDVKKLMTYNREADMTFNFNLLGLGFGGHAPGNHTRGLVETWMSNLTDGQWPNWVIGNHDNHRVASRIGQEYARAANMLLLLLPGTPFCYYGDEIGMMDARLSFNDTQDTFALNNPETYETKSRDPERTPMQWSDTENAGFTEAGVKPWLPVHDNYHTLNVQAQRAHSRSILHLFRALVQLRKEPTFQYGRIRYFLSTPNIFAFSRELRGSPTYLVAMNLGRRPETHSYYSWWDGWPRQAVVVLTSDLDREGETLDMKALTLRPGECVVLKWGRAWN